MKREMFLCLTFANSNKRYNSHINNLKFKGFTGLIKQSFYIRYNNLKFSINRKNIIHK